MEQSRRDEIKNVINECRRVLEEEFTTQLRFFGYNLDQSNIRIPIQKLTHLSSEAQQNRIWIDEAITKQMKSALTEKQAILRYINHCSFTFINRISALRAMEVRNLIEETIIPRDEYGGHSLRGRRISEENPSWNEEKILSENLKQGIHDVQNEIGSLFDENNEFAIISPNYRVSKQIIQLLSKRLTDEDWKSDEILGWIYQFFNCQSRDIFKEKKKEEKENPHPDEIPLINQFYTPKWVVQILVMNTIGRIYNSINPKSELKKNWSSFIDLNNKTHDIVLDEIKKIKILDPACGSGHFLIYSFDILYHIYKEFYHSMNDQEIINSILWDNLYGIDIDLRAIQIAGLNLYLKAKSINKNVKISNMNLICADSKIINKEKTKKIIQKLNFSVELQESFISLFNDLDICFALGSILKIPNEFILNWQNKKAKQRSIEYFSELNENTDRSIINILKKLEKEAMDTKNVSDIMFYNETEKSIGLLTLLSQKYDVILMNPPYGAIPKITKDYIKRKYTIGYSEDETQKKYIPYHDYYETFLLQCNNLLKENGFVGMLIPNSYLYLDSFDYLRKYLFQEDLLPIYNLDLGYGILDQATTRTAAAVLNKVHKSNGNTKDKIEGVFWDLKNFETHESKYSNFVSSLTDHQNSKIIFKRNIKSFNFMTSSPYYYYMPNEIFDLLENNDQLDDRTKDISEKITLLEWGISTGDDTRYLRYLWEIKSNEIGINKKWRFCVAGGTRTPYLNSIDTVILWDNNGQEIRNMRYKDGTMKSRPKDSEFWNRINNSYGFIWPKIKSKDFLNVSFRPKYVTSLDSNGIGNPLDNNYNLENLLGILNSQIITKIVKIFDPLDHFRFVKTIAQLPIPKQWKNNEMNQLVNEIITFLIFFESCNEKSIIFQKPLILNSLDNLSSMDLGVYDLKISYDNLSSILIANKPISLLDRLKSIKEMNLVIWTNILQRQVKIESIVSDLYHFNMNNDSDNDIKKVDNLINYFSQKISSINDNENEFYKNCLENLISFYIKSVIDEEPDEIIPLNSIFQNNLFLKIRELFMKDFRNSGEIIELNNILGKELNLWINQEYFEFHILQYEKRPIYWQLTSYQCGKSRTLPGVFSCLIDYHRISNDTIPKLQVKYVNPVKMQLASEKNRIQTQLEESRADKKSKITKPLQKQFIDIENQINEIVEFENRLQKLITPKPKRTQLPADASWLKRKTTEVSENGWKIDIDDGVLVNIHPLKELKLLPKSADKVK